MKKLTMIVMQGCPYCAAARRAIKELKAEQATYAPLTVEEIEDGSAAAQGSYLLIQSPSCPCGCCAVNVLASAVSLSV